MGNATADKSTLINCLNFGDTTEKQVWQTIKNNHKNDNLSTTGMPIVEKKSDLRFIVYFYDFGGQKHFHGTYNLFLDDVICLFVFDKQDEKADYKDTIWNFITSFFN